MTATKPSSNRWKFKSASCLLSKSLADFLRASSATFFRAFAGALAQRLSIGHRKSSTISSATRCLKRRDQRQVWPNRASFKQALKEGCQTDQKQIQSTGCSAALVNQEIPNIIRHVKIGCLPPHRSTIKNSGVKSLRCRPSIRDSL